MHPTRDAIAKRDFATMRRHLSLVTDLFDRADAELYEAIRISWLEALFIGETSTAYAEARNMLTKPMENVLRQANGLGETPFRLRTIITPRHFRTGACCITGF